MNYHCYVCSRERVVNYIQKVILLISIMLPAINLRAERAYDIAATATGGALIIGSELGKESLAPAQPRWSETNPVDDSIRNSLWWGSNKMHTAALVSDLMLYGVFIPAPLWIPATTNQNYETQLLIMSQAIVATGVITQAVKFSAARQRPYAHYKSAESKGRDDNLSFFSGHSSYTMAIAVSSAFLLSKSYPDRANLIWPVAVGLSLFTGYLRIGADKHYFTDVLTGFIVGAAIGYAITSQRYTAYSRNENGKEVLFARTFVF